MHYLKGHIESIPIVKTKLEFRDFIGALKARWSINRNNYKIFPGLYAVGKPENNSDIFVSANYKLSFDHLRKNLDGLNAWILVIDTKGINVWCAAGKETFGTEELINKINYYLLNSTISTKKVIIPQLGAVGVSAHEVKHKTGYKVIYGPVEASDIKSFIENNYTATELQRKVYFKFKDRIVLSPIEIVGHFKYVIFLISAMFILAGFKKLSFNIDNSFNELNHILPNIMAAYFGGTFIVPILLPYIPFRNFAFKGLFVGFVLSAILLLTNVLNGSLIEIVSWFMINMSISSFTGMNFTGSSTYTSFSGVMKEMRVAIPIQLILSIVGIFTWIILRFL